MKKIPRKNYIILFIMFASVVVITLLCAEVYKNRNKETSVLFNYVRNIKSGELDQYLEENPTTIIYISDKYNINQNDNEELIKEKIIEFNLYNNFIYIDKREFNSKFINKFNNHYKANINCDNLPTMIIFNDSVIENIYYNISNEVIEKLNLGDVK